MSAPERYSEELPRSDVSPWVGLVGLLGLFGFILLCRNWPILVEQLGLPGPREKLSGPHAALAAMVFTGLLMAGWSIVVDKVHRSPTTGIDWANPRPIAETLETSIAKLAGLWSTWAALAVFYCLGRWYWDGQYLFAMRVLGYAVVPMVLLSIPYILWLDRFLKEPRDHGWHFGALVIGRDDWDRGEVNKHWRAWAIKGFFGAFMISILPPGFQTVVEADIPAIIGDPVRIGMTLFELLFVIDVQIGTVGYLLTLRPLDSHIRSGNPHLAGWLAALMCYPPFVFAFMGQNGILNYEVNTGGWGYWLSGQPTLLWLWAAWLVFLTAIYAWATFAFGIRFSNLTYRGVLTNGPYRFTRHPAYLSKNLFWWCSVLPFMVTSGSWVDVLRNTACLACVSGIYYWRARTEEAHLLSEDAKYRAYHAWMAQHGLLTSRLVNVLGRLRLRPFPQPQPAE